MKLFMSTGRDARWQLHLLVSSQYFPILLLLRIIACFACVESITPAFGFQLANPVCRVDQTHPSKQQQCNCFGTCKCFGPFKVRRCHMTAYTFLLRNQLQMQPIIHLKQLIYTCMRVRVLLQFPIRFHQGIQGTTLNFRHRE